MRCLMCEIYNITVCVIKKRPNCPFLDLCQLLQSRLEDKNETISTRLIQTSSTISLAPAPSMDVTTGNL